MTKKVIPTRNNFTKLIYPFFFDVDSLEVVKALKEQETDFIQKGNSVDKVRVWDRLDTRDQVRNFFSTDGLYPYVQDLFNPGCSNLDNTKRPVGLEDQTSIFTLNNQIVDKLFLSSICILSRDARKLEKSNSQLRPKETYPFNVSNVVLLILDSGLGILILHVELRGKRLSMDSVLGFNYGIKILDRYRGLSIKRKSPPANVKLDEKEIRGSHSYLGHIKKHREFIPQDLMDIIDGLLLASIPKKNANQWERIFDRNLSLFSYVQTDDYDSIKSSFFAFHLFVKGAFASDGYDAGERYLQLFSNSRFAVNHDGAAIMACGNSDYIQQQMKRAASTEYFTIYLLCLIQKLILLRVSNEIADLFADLSPGIFSDRKLLKAVGGFNRRFLEFESFLWFSQISNETMKQDYYEHARLRIGNIALFEEIKGNINELYAYLKGRTDRAMNGFLQVITTVFFPITILAAVFGMNVEEVSDISPLFRTLVFQPFGWLCIALILIYLIFILMMLRRKED